MSNRKLKTPSATRLSANQFHTDRRTLARRTLGGGALVVAAGLNDSWITPVVRSVVLPAHAQVSVIGGGVVVPPDPVLTGRIRVTSILWRQTASNDPDVLVDEYVDFVNDDVLPINVQDWTLSDNNNNFTATFPPQVVLPGETCRVYVHAPPGMQACEFTFGRTSPGSSGNYVFNNTGDSATLRDASGMTIDVCTYTGSDSNPYTCPQ